MTDVPFSRILAALEDISADIAGVRHDVRTLIAVTNSIRRREIAMTAQLDALTTEVHGMTDAVTGAEALLATLSQKIADLKDDPVALQALADELSAKRTELAEAIAANTPAEP